MVKPRLAGGYYEHKQSRTTKEIQREERRIAEITERVREQLELVKTMALGL